MRAREFIVEAKYGSASDTPADSSKLEKDALGAIKGAISMPDISQNKQGGSPYLQWRFGIALAGSPDFDEDMPATGATAGDPLLSTYSDVELEIVNAAAKKVGAGRVNQLTSNRSHERDDTQKVSPLKAFKGYE
jgi:hypothetical protein